MRFSISFRFILTILGAACIFGWASFHALRALNESTTRDMRKQLVSYMVRVIESGPYPKTVEDFKGRELLWVMDADGNVLATDAPTPSAIHFEELQKPELAHEYTFHYGFLKFVPDMILVKLDSKDNVYALVELKRPGFSRSVLWVQITFLLFVVAASVVVALLLIFIYFKRKSKEAREVLARLEKGDLKARFEMNEFDEMGSIMGDFNRMASEIERLVHRVQETEQARTHLLEELGHDIRTPLTSLRTSVDTLVNHMEEMPVQEQRELISVIQSELEYFIPLIEGLFFIARLAEPRYKKTTEKVELAKILKDEMKSREAQYTQLEWRSNLDQVDENEAWVMGDGILIQRMIKNALDNAFKMASSFVELRMELEPSTVNITIEDDGVGISDDEISAFGQRKKKRPHSHSVEKSVSLGLGSVIIKTILDLHRGTLTIERRESKRGTRLTLTLPRGAR